jgi:diketogulonate reductase-like aldo/keto reductase
MPMVDQMEWHPYFAQEKNFQYCKENSILFEAWSPLMCGGEVLEDAVIGKIAVTHHKTPGQVILRWHIQSERRVFPKSVTPGRIEENFNIFDFELSESDITEINQLTKRDIRIGPDPDIYFDRG